ncbi:hypothetical protein CEUSTIGMA_g10810.t1 [Chlamydomonas eustigma]|uniref:Uncharacterized protein n=1 Tax=Chlamydomonas eustigma TaxID=1157962 RepID=A0A250XJX4_9CHLO|nr:hypothetical protein CEUSTIGMA_g10810.t1 [Chlamydomonas eustigma]|eukprot:GAX83385.1 hypothetical protein CEUSTIGMA_g10810.t1 [Chlamydomonas eustigma]
MLRKELCEAIHDGNFQEACTILHGDQKLAASKVGGKPIIEIAASCGQVQTVKLLLECGANASSIRDEDGRSTLHSVCEDDLGIEMARLLLRAGADPNAADFSAWTPLHCCAAMGAVPYAALLLEAGAKVDALNDSDQTPLLLACESSDSQWVNRGCDYQGVVSLLLQHHANVNQVDSFGETPLHMAVRFRKTKIAELLCASGSLVNTVSGHPSGDMAPLHISSSLQDVETVRVLVRAGADVDQEHFGSGNTPLMISIQQSSDDLLVKELITAGARAIRPSTLSGLTAVHIAAHCGHRHILKFLMSTIATADNDPPYCSSSHDIAPSEGLRSEMARIVPTPMHLACSEGHFEVVQYLLNAAPQQASSKDSQGATPLDVALKKGHHLVSNLIMEYITGQHSPVATQSDYIIPLINSSSKR